MDVSALLAEYRRRADDAAAQPFVEDDVAIAFAAEAESEAALRANLLWDDSATTGRTRYAVAVDQPTIRLSTLLYRIDSATFTPETSTRAQPLTLTGIDWIQSQCAWQTQKGQPCRIAHVGRTEALLYPSPTTAGILLLQGYRLPLFPLEDQDDEPEIPEEHHLGLVDWMLYRTFDTKDGEYGDPTRAAKALDDFVARFGERPTANVMRKQRERRRVTTRYAG